MAGSTNFYYAGGERIPLEPDLDLVAIDSAKITGADLESPAARKLLADSRPLKSAVSLVSSASIPTDLRARWDRAGALHPVYHHGDTLLVILPEVRAEDADTARLARVRDWLESAKIEAVIVSQRDNLIVLRPTSGRGKDALDLANRLHEELGAASAQARMLRVVARPT